MNKELPSKMKSNGQTSLGRLDTMDIKEYIKVKGMEL